MAPSYKKRCYCKILSRVRETAKLVSHDRLISSWPTVSKIILHVQYCTCTVHVQYSTCTVLYSTKHPFWGMKFDLHSFPIQLQNVTDILNFHFQSKLLACLQPVNFYTYPIGHIFYALHWLSVIFCIVDLIGWETDTFSVFPAGRLRITGQCNFLHLFRFLWEMFLETITLKPQDRGKWEERWKDF